MQRQRQEQSGERHHVRRRAGDAVLEIALVEEEELEESPDERMPPTNVGVRVDRQLAQARQRRGRGSPPHGKISILNQSIALATLVRCDARPRCAEVVETTP